MQRVSLCCIAVSIPYRFRRISLCRFRVRIISSAFLLKLWIHSIDMFPDTVAVYRLIQSILGWTLFYIYEAKLIIFCCWSFGQTRKLILLFDSFGTKISAAFVVDVLEI